LPPELDPISVEKCPPPRVLLKDMAHTTWDSSYSDSEKTEVTSHKAVVKVNDRITAQDWFQDVRHIELDFGDDIK
jgi:sulfite reductase alpha subunit-like flavoprotein